MINYREGESYRENYIHYLNDIIDGFKIYEKSRDDILLNSDSESLKHLYTELNKCRRVLRNPPEDFSLYHQQNLINNITSYLISLYGAIKLNSTYNSTFLDPESSSG
jgi:hypothetical protein